MTTTDTRYLPSNIVWLDQLTISTKMSCGMREPVSCDEGRTLRVKVLNGRRWLEITLDPSDTYTVRLVRVKRGTYERVIVEEHEGIYVDMLNETCYRTCNK